MSFRAQRLDPDFSREVLEDLYRYRRKYPLVAWALWLGLGWLGIHRFYLERELTGAVMLLTGGGGLIWWVVDAFLLNGMIRTHNEEQARRRKEGLPPVGLDAMPRLTAEDLERTPDWVKNWQARRPFKQRLRFAGDTLVLLIAGSALGGVSGVEGALEAQVAVVLLIGITALGAGPAWLDDVPLAGHLDRWSHRLRLFYYHNKPGNPVVLLLRPALGIVWAPFRGKDRAEVKLYVELGAAFTVGFLLLDLFQELVVPALFAGAAVELESIARGLMRELLVTFFLTYAFAAPIGAVLNLYLLVRDTHTVPRLLSAFALAAILLGTLGS